MAGGRHAQLISPEDLTEVQTKMGAEAWCRKTVSWYVENVELKGHTMIWHGPWIKVCPPIEEVPPGCVIRSEVLDETEHLYRPLSEMAVEVTQEAYVSGRMVEDYVTAFAHLVMNLLGYGYEEEARFWKRHAKKVKKYARKQRQKTSKQVHVGDHGWED